MLLILTTAQGSSVASMALCSCEAFIENIFLQGDLNRVKTVWKRNTLDLSLLDWGRVHEDLANVDLKHVYHVVRLISTIAFEAISCPN